MANSELLNRLTALTPIQQVALCQTILARLTANPEVIHRPRRLRRGPPDHVQE